MSSSLGVTMRIKTSDFEIATCSSYCSKWKEIKDTNDESWKFDEIESGKESFRKLFHQKMTIFHYCYSCFEKSVMMNPFVLSSDAPAGHCLMAKYGNRNMCSDICPTCIWFFISQFKDELHFL